MRRLFRQTGTIFPILIASLLIFATPAFANSIFIGLTGLQFPVFWGWATTGVLLLIVMVIEAVVYYYMLQMSFGHAVGIAVLLNIVSIAFGFVMIIFGFIGGMIFPLIPLAILIGVAYFSWRTELPKWVTAIFLAGAIAGFYPMMAHGMWDGIAIYISLLLALFGAFAFTLFSESWVMIYLSNSEKIFRAVLIANIISYILISGFAFYEGPSHRWYVTGGGRYSAWESRAKGTLRSIGSAQLAYQNSNNARFYGSFDALQNVGDIAEGYTLENMIEGYTMTWEIDNFSTVPTEAYPNGRQKTFIVIAWPEYQTMLLRTFAITEDQVVRFYNPGNDNELGDVRTWDPIL